MTCRPRVEAVSISAVGVELAEAYWLRPTAGPLPDLPLLEVTADGERRISGAVGPLPAGPLLVAIDAGLPNALVEVLFADLRAAGAEPQLLFAAASGPPAAAVSEEPGAWPRPPLPPRVEARRSRAARHRELEPLPAWPPEEGPVAPWNTALLRCGEPGEALVSSITPCTEVSAAWSGVLEADCAIGPSVVAYLTAPLGPPVDDGLALVANMNDFDTLAPGRFPDHTWGTNLLAMPLQPSWTAAIRHSPVPDPPRGPHDAELMRRTTVPAVSGLTGVRCKFRLYVDITGRPWLTEPMECPAGAIRPAQDALWDLRFYPTSYEFTTSFFVSFM